jgi:hypothetical protein
MGRLVRNAYATLTFLHYTPPGAVETLASQEGCYE